MRKLILILFALISLHVNAQESKINIKDIFKFGTVYGAVNGGTSLSDEDVYSVTNGLQTSINETPYDYSILFLTIWYCSVIFRSIPDYSVLFHTMLYYSILLCSIPYYSFPFHAIPFHSTLFRITLF